MLGGLALHARLWPPTLVAGEWFARLAWLNFLLGGFNLLPALPMDGGRVLRAGLAGGLGRREATRLAGRIARAIAVALIVGGVLYDFWLALIGVFVFLGSNAEEQAAQTSARHEDRRDEHDQHRPPADRSCDPTSPR